LFNTVVRNRQQFITRECQDAEAAKELSKLLGHPSPRSFIEMINNGSIVKCPVTAKDVARAYQIFGPNRYVKIPENRKLPERLSSIFPERYRVRVSYEFRSHSQRGPYVCQYKCISN